VKGFSHLSFELSIHRGDIFYTTNNRVFPGTLRCEIGL